MTWVPWLFGLLKIGVVGATIVLCVRSQREGEREDQRRREAQTPQGAPTSGAPASKPG